MIDITKLKEVDKGRQVKYIPRHAKGDRNHKDCETGIISSWSNIYIFVRFTTGSTAAGVRPQDLVFENE